MKKILRLLLVLIFAVAVLSGCAQSNSLLGGMEIAVMLPGATHGWTGAVLLTAKEETDRINAEGIYNCTLYAATSADAQNQQVKELLDSDNPPDGIVILPYDNNMEAALVEIAGSGIPYVMFDRIVENETVQEKVTANVKGDNFQIGALTAQRFVEQGLEPGDDIFVIIGDNSTVPLVRNEGFVAELKNSGWTDEQIEQIEYTEPTGWDRDSAKQLFIDWVNDKTPEQLAEYEYIFAHDDEIAMGVLEALVEGQISEQNVAAISENLVSLAASSGLQELYDVIAGEHENALINEVAKNFDLFSVTYSPDMIKNAIEDMTLHLEGTDVEKDHVIGVEVVDSENVNSYQGF